MSEANPEPLSAVVGRNVRSLREGTGRTQDLFARELRSVGLPWTRRMLAKAENGEREITLQQIVLLAYALGVPLPALLTGPGRIALTSHASISARGLELMVRGERSRGSDLDTPMKRDPSTAMEGLIAWEDAEVRAADRLSTTPLEIRMSSARLWGRPFTAERDRRVEALRSEPSPRTRQALRGHVTRELLEELAAAIKPTGTKKARKR